MDELERQMHALADEQIAATRVARLGAPTPSRRPSRVLRLALVGATAIIVAIIGWVALDRGDPQDRTVVAEPSSVSTPASATLGDGSSTTASGPGSGARCPEPSGPIPVPSVVVRSVRQSLCLDPFTACYTGGCYDGFPPVDLEKIGRGDVLQVEFAQPGWEFTATVVPYEQRNPVPTDRECGVRSITAPLTATSANTFELTPIGPARHYAVTLFGRAGPTAPQGGDVIVAFDWTTQSDGVLPKPKATTSILAAHDGVVDSYGVEFGISDLARTPTRARASVVVTSADGQSFTIDLAPTNTACAAEGSVTLEPTDPAILPAEFGAAPFTYDATVVLDGTTYRATATWPTDEDPECAPCVPLEFTPRLPAMAYN